MGHVDPDPAGFRSSVRRPTDARTLDYRVRARPGAPRTKPMAPGSRPRRTALGVDHPGHDRNPRRRRVLAPAWAGHLRPRHPPRDAAGDRPRHRRLEPSGFADRSCPIDPSLPRSDGRHGDDPRHRSCRCRDPAAAAFGPAHRAGDGIRGPDPGVFRRRGAHQRCVVARAHRPRPDRRLHGPAGRRERRVHGGLRRDPPGVRRFGLCRPRRDGVRGSRDPAVRAESGADGHPRAGQSDRGAVRRLATGPRSDPGRRRRHRA